jgi:hypothetical protein
MSKNKNLQALVATSKYLLLVDIESGEKKILNDKYGLFYGITWDENYIYVAVRWYPSLTPTSHIERPRLLVFDFNFKLQECQKFDVYARGLHQISFYDSKLYCSCSRDDSFIIRENGEWRTWYPSSNSEDHNKDTHHFNSIWFNEGNLFIVGHNNGPSDVWEFSYPDFTLKNKYRVGSHIHNVWKENGILTVCNSRNGRIETIQNQLICETGGFPRGVAIGDEINLVGVSDIANRSNRWLSRGKVNIYTKDWKMITSLDLGKCGQVLEVRMLGDDYAHNGKFNSSKNRHHYDCH